MRRALLAVLLLAPGTALAQARDPAAAEALFKSGVELLEKDDWAGACPKFEASARLDPSVGAQINVARCAEHDGKLARAWAELEKARVLNRETPGAKRKREVDAFIDESLKRIEPRLPWITVRISERPEGLRIERDGVELPLPTLDAPVPIDPGRHVFTATAPGYETIEKPVDAAEGGKTEILLEMRRARTSPASPPPSPPVGPTQPPPPAPPVAGPGVADSGVDLVVVGAVIASIGAATLVVAAVTGGIAMSDESRIGDLVDSGACTRTGETLRCGSDLAEAEDAVSRGETLSVVSTVTLFAGAAIAATGLTLVIVEATSQPSEKPTVGVLPLLGPDGAGVMMTMPF